VIAEGLVIFSCLNHAGCSETSSHYYALHPEIREIVDFNEKRIKRYVGPVVIETAGPVLFVIAGGTGTIKLNRYFSLQFDRQSGTLSFKKDY
jgi:hypothetical protein